MVLRGDAPPSVNGRKNAAGTSRHGIAPRADTTAAADLSQSSEALPILNSSTVAKLMRPDEGESKE
jgi:hypothetical protein